MRKALASEDADRSVEAIEELRVTADKMTQALDSKRKELECTRNIFVEVMPKALGVTAGVAAGTFTLNCPGAELQPGCNGRHRSCLLYTSPSPRDRS